MVTTLKGLLNSALSSGTHKLYQRAWATFAAFTQQSFHSDNLELPISIPSLALFISYLHARKLASSTIKSYLSAISYVHKLKGLRDPTQAFLINKLLTALSRQGSCDIRLPISRPVLHELVGSLGHTTLSAFQRTLYSAMFLLAFYGFFLFWQLGSSIQSTPLSHSARKRSHDKNNNHKVQTQCHKSSIRYLDRTGAFLAILPRSGYAQFLQKQRPPARATFLPYRHEPNHS